MYDPLKDLKTVWYATDHNSTANLEAMGRLTRWIEGKTKESTTGLMAQLIYQEVQLRIARDGRRTDLEALVDRCAEAKANMDRLGAVNTFGLNATEEAKVNSELVMWQAAYWQARRELQNAAKEYANVG